MKKIIEMIERAIDQMTKEELNELTKNAYRRLGELGTSESDLAEIRAKYGLNEKGGLYD